MHSSEATTVLTSGCAFRQSISSESRLIDIAFVPPVENSRETYDWFLMFLVPTGRGHSAESVDMLMQVSSRSGTKPVSIELRAALSLSLLASPFDLQILASYSSISCPCPWHWSCLAQDVSHTAARYSL